MRAVRFLAAVGFAALVAAPAVEAQTRFMYVSGQTVSPAYEGWMPNEATGGYTLFYGYMNTNWEEEFDIPVGSRNYFTVTEAGGLDNLERSAFDAGQADRGQPTHFYPRRNPFLFTIEVPADFGARELVWTLTTHGQTLRAYGSLAMDYRIDPQVISTEIGGNFGSLDDRLRTNVPPTLDVEGSLARTVRVGEPLELVAVSADPDNYPARRGGRAGGAPATLQALYNTPSSIIASSGPGLRLSWTVFRGPASATRFDPEQMKAWTDTRVWGNSPWSPPYFIPEPPEGGRWVTRVTFSRPGDYTLRAVASDGSIFTYENVTVRVTP